MKKEGNEGNEKKFALAVAICLCVLMFCVFIAQAFWSDVVTFHKSGDDLKGVYPAFRKIAKYLDYHSFLGVDTDSFNGATEFFCRPNLANLYLPAIIAGWLMKWLPNRGLYILFYMFHMLFASYFSMRLAQRFFGLGNKAALLFTCSWATVVLYESYYLWFYVISALLPVAVYSQLCIFERSKCRWRDIILFAFPYVLCITSGYITVSAVLAGMTFLAAVAYGVVYKKLGLSVSVKRTALPCLVGGVTCLPYLLQLLAYEKKVVQSTSALSFTLALRLNFLDMKNIVTNALGSESPIEQMSLLTLGMFWCFIIALLIYYKVLERMKREERAVLRLGIGVNAFFVFVALGTVLPFVLWFYSFVPVFGSMHLPLRYLMVTLLLLYMGLAVSVKYIPDLKQKKSIKHLAIGTFVVGFAGLVAFPYINSEKLQKERLLLELFLLAVIFCLTYAYGLMHSTTVAVSCFFILLPGLTFLYNYNEVSVAKPQITERSIVYSTEEQARLDDYVASLGEKERYLYVAFDSMQGAPNFLPGNYGWYGYSRFCLSNYSGYDIHLTAPADYVERFPWFDIMDWNYVTNTRGDFLVLDEPSIEGNREVLDKIVDWENSGGYLDSTHRILTLKKFVPDYYTGQPFVEDRSDTLDNGYFYCPDVHKEDLTAFQTDHASYFYADIESERDSTVAFLLYPNRYFHYYVNGQEVEPVIHEMQAYLPIQKGSNSIEVAYENKMAQIQNGAFAAYYLAAAGCAVWGLLAKKRRKGQKDR